MFLKFCCSDYKYKAYGYLNLEKDEFNPNKDKNNEHIEYELHSYLILDLLKNKYNNKKFKEIDF